MIEQSKIQLLDARHMHNEACVSTGRWITPAPHAVINSEIPRRCICWHEQRNDTNYFRARFFRKRSVGRRNFPPAARQDEQLDEIIRAVVAVLDDEACSNNLTGSRLDNLRRRRSNFDTGLLRASAQRKQQQRCQYPEAAMG